MSCPCAAPFFSQASRGANPQPAILTTSAASNRIIVFPDPGNAPANHMVVPGLPANAIPQGVAYYSSDRALVADFQNARIFVIDATTP